MPKLDPKNHENIITQPSVIQTEERQHVWIEWPEHDQQCHCARPITHICACGLFKVNV